MMRSIRKILYIFILSFSVCIVASCDKDEATKTYSTANMVRCFFNVPQYTQLFNVMGNYGEYATIRGMKGQGKIQMSSNVGTTEYPMTADMQGFEFGLGGLIVGTSYFGEHFAYDLACPNCNRSDRRLTIGDAGIAKCAKCGLSYDLNNYGVISAASHTDLHTNPRGLLRYRIVYDEVNLRVFN